MSELKSITFSIFQWNTLNRKLSDNEAFPLVKNQYLQWYYRHPLIKKIIEENKSDIICLEEVGNFDLDFKQKIFDKCTVKYDLVFGARKNKLMGNVLGVNKELFSIEKHENIILNGENGNPSGQNIISALINDKTTNNKFLIIVVHLKCNIDYEKTRLCQIEHIIKYIEENHLGKYPIFIIGDFNAEPDYSCIKYLFENKNINIKSLFTTDELEFTTYNIKDKIYKRILDYIFFIGKNKDDENEEIIILNKEKGKPNIDEKIGLPNEIFPSDHLFLKAQIQLNFF